MMRIALVKLSLALIAALSFAVLAAARFDGDFEHLLLTYFTPIIVPFVAFVFDRLTRRSGLNWRGAWLDIVIILVSMLRAIAPVPLISGHSLFLTYMLLRSRSRLTRALCLMVFAQVAYLKLWVWHDTTFWGGIIAGIGGYLLYLRLTSARERQVQRTIA